MRHAVALVQLFLMISPMASAQPEYAQRPKFTAILAVATESQDGDKGNGLVDPATLAPSRQSAMTISRNEMNHRLVKLAESPNIRFWRIDYDQLSFPERVVGLIWELESEVNNGGFYQYFWNSSGALAPNVVDALKTIGASTAAGIAQQAFAVVGPDIGWSDDATRKALISQLTSETKEKLHKLDKAFYAYPDDLTTLLYRYVTEHRSELRAPADF